MIEWLPYILFIFALGYVYTVPANDTDYPDELYIIELQDEKLDRDGAIACTGTQMWDKGADIVSADPLVPGSDGNLFHVTGTTNFAAINAAQSQPGTVHCYVFDGILTMTHHATNLILLGGANITTAAGDRAIFIEEDTDKWRCVVYTKADGTAIVAVSDKISEGDSSVEVIDAGTGYIETKADNSQVRKDQVIGNLQPLQPAFLAYNSASEIDATGDGTAVTLDFDTEIFDQGGNFAADVFTAPLTGRYYLDCSVMFVQLNVDSYEDLVVKIITSNRTYEMLLSGLVYNSGGYMSHHYSAHVDMDINDTAYVVVVVSGGAKSVDIYGGAGSILYTRFSGHLVC